VRLEVMTDETSALPGISYAVCFDDVVRLEVMTEMRLRSILAIIIIGESLQLDVLECKRKGA
jgi:hypothetical protein